MFPRLLFLCAAAAAAAASSGALAARWTSSTSSHAAASAWTVSTHYHEAAADVEEPTHPPHNLTFTADEGQAQDGPGGHSHLESLDDTNIGVLRGDEEVHDSEDGVEEFTQAEKFAGIALGRALQSEHRCYSQCGPTPSARLQ